MEIARLWHQSDPDWFFFQSPEDQVRLMHWYEGHLSGAPLRPEE